MVTFNPWENYYEKSPLTQSFLLYVGRLHIQAHVEVILTENLTESNINAQKTIWQTAQKQEIYEENIPYLYPN